MNDDKPQFNSNHRHQITTEVLRNKELIIDDSLTVSLSEGNGFLNRTDVLFSIPSKKDMRIVLIAPFPPVFIIKHDI